MVEELLKCADLGCLDLTIKDNENNMCVDVCMDEKMKQVLWDKTREQQLVLAEKTREEQKKMQHAQEQAKLQKIQFNTNDNPNSDNNNNSISNTQASKQKAKKKSMKITLKQPLANPKLP
ncbi:hypothetical protein RFI_39935 [Reticulomyxa filosa]|uniref:Uncharacterized protein n=1 Tax=Reticulomyxa filosa TaxID=46433 RepID=X6LA22_RETFI|nr:hypothetical protein RFI_39935 [Reticulomyxa filosa]|eukprot:ETN97594.1 hypothetical protein RFI_39935 [Reticulomyxa filosa]